MVLQLVRDWGMEYLLNLPAHVRSGDLIAILITLLLLYGGAVLLSKVTPLILEIAKKTVIFAIIAISAHIFLLDFIRRSLAAGFTLKVAFFGALGLLIAIFAVSIALYRAATAVWAHRKQERLVPESPPIPGGEAAGTPATPGTGMAEASSLVAAAYRLKYLTRENSLGMVILYLVIAEFGIFSSRTIAAATAEAGLSFFLIFILAALIFIRIRYADYRTGVRHLAIVCILGFIFSLILGHFWGGIPGETLLSMDYFRSEALVALITGMSLSLFLTNKG
ncbi:MAG: hypothetical protein APR53_08520 [Methanoculleus sp. SDB]|nr:MAG: hypothetical protein APR53_08520 [Methanoculleus sp. SDB]